MAAPAGAAETVGSVQSMYAPVIASLEQKLEAGPEDTSVMASLGNNYMDMGSAMRGADDYEGNEDAAAAAFLEAVRYYDVYLGLAGSPAVVVDRGGARRGVPAGG